MTYIRVSQVVFFPAKAMLGQFELQTQWFNDFSQINELDARHLNYCQAKNLEVLK